MTPPRTTELLVDLTPEEVRALARGANLLAAIAAERGLTINGDVPPLQSAAMKLETALMVAGEES